MKEEKAKLVHDTIVNLVDGMLSHLDEHDKLTVFYAYSDKDETASGFHGDSTYHEKIGILEQAKYRLMNQ